MQRRAFWTHLLSVFLPQEPCKNHKVCALLAQCLFFRPPFAMCVMLSETTKDAQIYIQRQLFKRMQDVKEIDKKMAAMQSFLIGLILFAGSIRKWKKTYPMIPNTMAFDFSITCINIQNIFNFKLSEQGGHKNPWPIRFSERFRQLNRYAATILF